MLDLLSICVGMALGIFLTVAATILAAFLHDCREMRRIAHPPVQINFAPQWYPVAPPAQVQPSPLTPKAMEAYSALARARERSNSQKLPLIDRLPDTEPRIPVSLRAKKLAYYSEQPTQA